MEQAAVGVVARELDLKTGRVVEGLGGSGKARLDVVGLGGEGELGGLGIVLLILDLLLVVVDEGLLLDVRIGVDGAGGRLRLLEGAHAGL